MSGREQEEKDVCQFVCIVRTKNMSFESRASKAAPVGPARRHTNEHGVGPLHSSDDNESDTSPTMPIAIQ